MDDELESASAAIEVAADAVEEAENAAEGAQEAAQAAASAAMDATIAAEIVTEQAENRVEEIQQEAAAEVAETIIDYEEERAWTRAQIVTLLDGMTILTATVSDLQQLIQAPREVSIPEMPNRSEAVAEDSPSQETLAETSSEKAEPPAPEPSPESQRPKRHRPRY